MRLPRQDPLRPELDGQDVSDERATSAHEPKNPRATEAPGQSEDRGQILWDTRIKQ
jgi:hypothetical protein